jgi:VWFA-related protein
MRVTPIGLLITVLVTASSTRAHSHQEVPVFRTETRTIPIYATVTDGRGRLVSGLAASDFVVADDRRAAPVSVFSNEPQPFTAVVLLDTSASVVGSLDLVKRAAAQFVSGLTAADRAQIGEFNERIRLSGTFTSDTAILLDALSGLEIGNPTRMYDAIAAGLDALRGVSTRRVVLIFTDGDDTASRLEFKTVLARARDEEVMVYAVGLETEYFNGARVVKTRPTRNLKTLAEETGGGYFELLATADLAPTFARVVEELRSHYLLGFVPMQLDGRAHALDVRVVRAGMSVRARKSYIAARNAD